MSSHPEERGSSSPLRGAQHGVLANFFVEMEDDALRAGRLRDTPGGGLGGWQVEDLPQEQLQSARPVSTRPVLRWNDLTHGIQRGKGSYFEESKNEREWTWREGETGGGREGERAIE